MARIDEILADGSEAVLCGEMQRCIGAIIKVWVAKVVGVVTNDALHQREVVEEDGAPETPGYVNPGVGVSDKRALCVEIEELARLNLHGCPNQAWCSFQGSIKNSFES